MSEEAKRPVMLTIKEAAALTGLSYDCVRRMCLENKVYFINNGNRRLISQTSLYNYLSGGENND